MTHEELARLIYEHAYGCDYEYRTIGTAGPYGIWADAVNAAGLILPIVKALCMEEAARVAEQHGRAGQEAAARIRALATPEGQ